MRASAILGLIRITLSNVQSFCCVCFFSDWPSWLTHWGLPVFSHSLLGLQTELSLTAGWISHQLHADELVCLLLPD
jgi:hypothetical protein